MASNITQSCPFGGVCAGGLLLATRGYWLPFSISPPSLLQPCPQPDASLRCPGSLPNSSASYVCGPGFAGQACSACASAYYSLAGSCSPCPRTSAAYSVLVPLLTFLAGLALACALLAALLYATLALRQRRHAALASGARPAAAALLRSTLAPVGRLLLWAWVSSQSCACLFFQAQALVPPPLAPF